VKGEYAFLFSTPRLDNPGSKDPIWGSQDWLTDIIVVDNPAKLALMTPTQTGTAYTSCSSRRVLVRWDVGKDIIGREEACLTIATGHNNKSGGHKPGPRDYLYADKVLVLPKDTVMDNNHRRWKEWQEGAIQFLVPASQPGK
jgi:hypothetical protein